ncbi:MAG: PKD domain-containing protein [Dehalococcoidia bacterium]
MKLRNGDKPIVTSTGYQDIRVNIWGERFGPRPKPTGLILLIILAVIALAGLYFGYQEGYQEPTDETARLEEDLNRLEENIERLMRPPEEEKEIKAIEGEIDILKSARETINAGYGYLAQIVRAIDETMPQTADFNSIRLGTDSIAMQGSADTPSGLFAIARAFEERSEFEKAFIKNIGTTQEVGRVMNVALKDAGSVDVAQMLMAPGESELSTVAAGIYFSDLIKDPLETESGHESGGSASENIRPYTDVSGISADVVSGNLLEPPVTIKFSGTANFYYPIDKYKWEFSDGAVKEVDLGDPGPRYLTISILHTFTREGAAGAALTVTDDHGHKVSAARGGMFASADTDFTAELVECDNPLKLKFEPQIVSAEKITSYEWYFGEGDGGEENGEPDSTERTPIHTFGGVGEYTVSLTVAGRLDKPVSVSHVVVASGTPTADFYPERVGEEDEFKVRFADASEPDGEADAQGNQHRMVQWEWDFGDGTIMSGSSTPVHTYEGEGPYTVTLKAWESDANCDTITKIVQASRAEYDQFYIESGQGEMQINFSAPVQDTEGKEFFWNFGVTDAAGNPVTSTSANPSHQYDYSGIYHVTLRIVEEVKSTKYEVDSVVSFMSADVEVISSTATPFQLQVIPAPPVEENEEG